jgi:translation initiation factor eIF-2B subunit alpha
METVEIVRAQSAALQAGVANPLPVKAGAEILKSFLDQTLRQPAGPTAGADPFEEMRQHLLANGRLFAQRARAARASIAERAAAHAAPGRVVLTAGGSRAVRDALLRAAAQQRTESGRVGFRVVYVADLSGFAKESAGMVAALRDAGIPVAEVGWPGVEHVMEATRVDRVLVGAESVTHDGHVVSRLGTAQLAVLAKSRGVQFIVLAELHKFVLQQIGGNRGLGMASIRQGDYINFRTESSRPEASASMDVLAPKNRVDFTVSFILTQKTCHVGARTEVRTAGPGSYHPLRD